MLSKLPVIILLFTLFFRLSPQEVFAAAPTITAPSTIHLDESFTVDASMSGLSNNAIYRLRIVLAKTSSSNYFGSTNNGIYWYNGNPAPIDYSKFLSITTGQDGTWSGDILGKIESSDPDYDNIGSSIYDLKIGRYTQTGSTATWSNTVQTNLVAVAPTSTPQPTPTQAKEPTPTKTPTPSPHRSTLISPISSSAAKSSAKFLAKSASLSGVPTSILGVGTQSADKKENSSDKQKILVDSASKLNPISISIGGVFMLACAILVFLKVKAGNHE